MKNYLILNPKSRGGKAARSIPAILARFEQSKEDYDYVYASSYENILNHSRFANEKGYERIIAVGGDGTINAVLNGFYTAEGTRTSRAGFGVIYTGTSPDFCTSYGIPINIGEAADAVFAGHKRNIRVGKITFRNGNAGSNTETRYFACCANIGLGARVANGANFLRKYVGDTAGTMISLLYAMSSYKAGEIHLSMDGVGNNIERVLNISVGRTRFIASGIKVKEGMEDDDERFYVLTANNVTLFTAPAVLRDAYSGNIGRSGGLSLRYASGISISSPGTGTEVEFDGDPAGYLPCEIELARDPLTLLGRFNDRPLNA